MRCGEYLLHFAFSPACVKAVQRTLSDEDSQGKIIWFFEGMQSVAGAFASLVAVAIFNWGTSGVGNEVLAMKYVILFYSFCEYRNGSICNIRSGKDDKSYLKEIRFHSRVLRRY